jgi:hypothetical protein
MADPIPPFILSETKGSALTNLEFSDDLRMIRVAYNAFLASYTPLPAIVPTTQGGTGANLTLTGNRIIISSGAVMAENSAILANRAIISNGAGLPTHSITTATEVSFSSGLTGNIQTQLDGKYDNPLGTTAQYIRGDGSIANFPTGLPPGGPAGGDLTGTYPSPLIGTNKVTYAKFQQVTASRLLGNPTGSLANASEISLGSGLVFSGSQLEVNGLLSQWITTGSDIYYDIGRVGIGTTTPSALLDLEDIWKYNGGSVTHSNSAAAQDTYYIIQNSAPTGYSSIYNWNSDSNGLSITTYGPTYVQAGQIDIAGATSFTSRSINWAVPDPYTFKIWTGPSGSLVENLRIEQANNYSLNRFVFDRGIALNTPNSSVGSLPYNVTINDCTVPVIASGGNVVLPDTTTLVNGHIVVIESLAGATFTLVPFNAGTENIMGAASYSVSANESVVLQKYPLNWRIVANYNAASFINAVTAPLQVIANNLSIATNGISDSLFRQSAALSVVGNSTNATANVADITAGADFNILRRSGTAIGFGAIDLSQSGAVGSSILGIANGGTGSTAGAWLLGGSYSLTSDNVISTGGFNVTFASSGSKNLRIASDGNFQIFNGATSGQAVVQVNLTGFNSLPAFRINPNGTTFTQNAIFHIRGESTSSNLALRIDDSAGTQLMGLTQNGQLNVPQTVAFSVTGTSGSFVTTRGLTVNVQSADITNLNNLFNLAPTATVGPITTEGAAYNFMNQTGSIGGNNLSNIRFSIFRSNPTYNFTGTGTGIVRGFYHSPTLTSLLSVEHRAFENTTGNLMFGTTSGSVGINLSTAPTAKLHIAAPTGTGASTAPLKLTNSTTNILATPEVGAFEFGTAGGNNVLFFTRNGTTREAVLTGVLDTGVATTGIEPTTVIKIRATDGNEYPVAIAVLI